jgi:hypothetical protein
MAQSAAWGQNEDKVSWASKIVKQYLGLDNLKPVPLEYVDDIDTFKKLIYDYHFGDKADRADGLFALSEEFGFSVSDNYSMDELLEEYAYATFGIYDERNDKLYVITPGLFEALKEKRYNKCDLREEDSDYIKYQDWRRQNLSNIVLVHVAAYMAQDQAYGLDSLYRKFQNNDDAALALRCISVGQGDIVREEYMKNELNVKNLFLPDEDMLHPSLQSSPTHSGPVPMLRYSEDSYGDRWSIKDFAGIQGSLSEYFTILGEHCDEDLSYIWWMRNFPFIFGGRFMNKVRVEKGWKATGDVFKRCPLSSEQIINSEKYFDPVKEDLPTFINLPSFDDVLDTNQWKYLDYNVVGQAFLYLICKTLQFDEENFCTEAMDGWDGDRYIVWNNADNDILLAAYTTWDSPEDSSEFFHFYDKAWSARGPYAGARTTTGDDKIMISGKGQSMLVERRGNDVIVIEGPVAEEQMQSMAETLWMSGKIEATYDICTMPEGDFKDEYPGMSNK